jgi:thiol-disulfide isomerase/thioredoxin
MLGNLQAWRAPASDNGHRNVCQDWRPALSLSVRHNVEVNMRISFPGKSSLARRVAIGGLLAISLIAAVACTSTLQQSPEGTSKPNASAVKNIQGETFEHGTFDLNDSVGKPVVLNFWFPSCPPCTAEMPDLQAAYAEYGDQVQFVGIQQLGLDSAEDGRKFLRDVGVTYPNIPDTKGEIWTGYGIVSFPTTLFLDRDHNIKRAWNGLLSAEALRDQIESLLEA